MKISVFCNLIMEVIPMTCDVVYWLVTTPHLMGEVP